MSNSRERQRPPVLRVEPVDPSPWLTRLAALVAAGAALLGMVGVPSVDLHGPLHFVGVMDPLCGGTRSVYLSVQGDLLDAAAYNPAGPVLLVVALAAVVRAATGRLSGQWVTVHVSSRVVLVACSAPWSRSR